MSKGPILSDGTERGYAHTRLDLLFPEEGVPNTMIMDDAKVDWWQVPEQMQTGRVLQQRNQTLPPLDEQGRRNNP
jgi:hypothetical protein